MMVEKVVVLNPFVGLCHMQVCAEKDATDEEILKVCNQENMAGTTNGWCDIVRSGDGAPVVCADDPERLHILAVC